MVKKVLFLILLLLSFSVLADVLTEREEFFFKLESAYHIPPFLLTMFLTAVIETFFLWCFGYRGWKVLTCFFVLNLISNLVVNLVYESIWRIAPYYVLVPTLESGVVLFEAGLLGLMTGYNKKLWLSVLATNLLSFLTGVLLFGL